MSRNESRRPDRKQSDGDALPPHSVEAEQGVLGCILLAPAVLAEARERFGITQPFYDLKHAKIWQVLCNLADEQEAGADFKLDLIILQQRLKDTGSLAEVGGLSYLAALPDKVPSAANLSFYLEIVWEKYVARVASRTLRKVADQIHTAGATVQVLEEISAQIGELQKAAKPASRDAMPPHVKRCVEFEEKYFNSFFGVDAEEPGTPLPFKHENFPFKFRRGELTFLLGEKGAGKTTLQSWIALNMARQGWKVFIASMEMKPETTLKILASQLIGKNKLEDCQQHHELAAGALAWLNTRFVIYDFLGIADWRELLDAQRYAVQFLGCDFFLTDSVMRLGIADDDYAEQGRCASAQANFCATSDVHGVLTNHLNKSEGHAKSRSRGSQQWIDNSHNVTSVERNEKKGVEVAEQRQKDEAAREAKEFDAVASAKRWAELNLKWDSKFQLHNQRWPGSRQNGSLYLWFDYPSQQLRDEVSGPRGVNWLEKWTRRKSVADL